MSCSEFMLSLKSPLSLSSAVLSFLSGLTNIVTYHPGALFSSGSVFNLDSASVARSLMSAQLAMCRRAYITYAVSDLP